MRSPTAPSRPTSLIPAWDGAASSRCACSSSSRHWRRRANRSRGGPMSRSPQNEDRPVGGEVEPEEAGPSADQAEENAPRLITSRLLRAWPLPQPDAQGDKEARGRVLIVGG